MIGKPLALIAVAVILASGADADAQGGMYQDFVGHQGHEMNLNLIIPQVAVGMNYQTTLVMHNLGNMEHMWWVAPQDLTTTGRIFLFKQDGSPMSASINGGLPASEMTFSLDPFSTMSLELTSEGPTVSGWCLIEVDDFEFGSSRGMMDGVDMIRGRRIMANVIYTYENGNTLSMVATHPNMYEMGYYSRSLLPVQNQNELHTGFAMVNISSQDATVELRLWDRYGQLNSMQTVSLHAGQQIAQYVHNRFEGVRHK